MFRLRTPVADSVSLCVLAYALCEPTSMWPGTALIEKGHRFQTGHIACFNELAAEPCIFDQCPNWPVQMTAAGDALPCRDQAVLPSAHALIGCQPVFDKEQLAARPEHAAHFFERGDYLRYAAQGPGGDDGIDAVVVQRG